MSELTILANSYRKFTNESFYFIQIEHISESIFIDEKFNEDEKNCCRSPTENRLVKTWRKDEESEIQSHELTREYN